MPAEANKASIITSFEVIFNQHQVDRAAEFYALDYLDHAAAPGTAPGLGGRRRWVVRRPLSGGNRPPARVPACQPRVRSASHHRSP